MKIGGLQKFSLCDFPGRTAAVVFTRGCNFRCQFCHNGNLISSRTDTATDLKPRQVIDFLIKRKGQLDGVVVCGGEPTLQAGLLPFLHCLRRLNYAIKLDTNGSRPDVIRDALDQNLLDFIAMDIKAPWETYEMVCAVPVDLDSIRESMSLIAGCRIPHEFRTTWVKSLLSETDLQQIRKQLPAGAVHRIQDFQSENALNPNLHE